MDQGLINFLTSFISEERLERLEYVLQERTDHIAVAVENVFQPHNASAVLRSCDVFGIQNVHIIENSNTYDPNPDVTIGADKWLDIIYHNTSDQNTTSCIRQLKANGFRVVGTLVKPGAYTPENLPLDQPVAIVMGTEGTGLSDNAIDMCDDFLHIPMFGFSESLNISVATAIILHQLTNRIREEEQNWKLSQQRYESLLLDWVKKSIKRPDLLEEAYRERSV